MFTFIHTYTPESWDGLSKHGMFRRGDGLKVMHACERPDWFRFNQMAAVGSPLEQKLRELRCPFYIDRLQGGVGLPYLYPFDPELLHHYRTLLGDKFWGFQMHEWSSNYRSDFGRITELYEKCGTPNPTPAERHAIFQNVRSGKETLFLEALTPHEWSSHRDPVSRAMFLDDIRLLYKTRCRMTGNRLIPADSYHMAPRIEIENGAQLLLPEVGWQIPGARMQIAYTRGMANAAAIRWGIYYECWCFNHAADGLTIPFSLREGQDEWGEDQLHTGIGTDRTPEERERGGTSVNLQERLWRFAYHAGAVVLGEEYGVCNTFRDYHDYDLSPYGQTKRDFLSYQERHNDVGTPFAPIAIVLPANLPILDAELRDNYLNYPDDDPSCLVSNAWTKQLRDTMYTLLGTNGSGNTGHVLRRGGYPDVFDILHADQESALSHYDYLIDLTDDPAFAAAHNNIVSIDALEGLLDRMLPCRIGGDLQTQYNRTKDGWEVLVLNNDGVTNDNFEGDRFDADAAVTTDIRFCGDHNTCRSLDGTGTVSSDGNRVTLHLAAGQWLLLGIG